jgi:hypothetical protein
MSLRHNELGECVKEKIVCVICTLIDDDGCYTILLL